MKIKKEKHYNRFVMEKRLLDDTNYTIFTKYSKSRSDRHLRIVGRNKWEKFINTVFDVVLEGIVETEAGVVLDEIGYFFIWEAPAKRPIKNFVQDEAVDYYNLHTGGRFFTPVYMPSRKVSNTFNLWTMDNSFSKFVKLGMSRNLTQGNKRYKNYMYTFHNLIK